MIDEVEQVCSQNERERKMAPFQFSILINQPSEKVFALVDQPADYPRWRSEFIDAGEESDSAE